jgi:hypothetical protein
MDEYLILLLFLGILFVLFFYREELFGKQQSSIIQPVGLGNRDHRSKKYNKNNKYKRRIVETETEQSEASDPSKKESRDDNSMGSFASKQSIQSHDTFPSIGSGLSQGNNKDDCDDTF